MLNIGCHLSTSKGFRHMGREALEIGANTFQFFTRNPRGSKAKKIEQGDVAGLIRICEEHEFAPLLGHAPYTLNPCSTGERTKEFALEVMIDDLERMEHLPNNLYNFHPGSHGGQGIENGIELIAAILNKIIKKDQTTTVLLETMSGKGTEIGGTFEELREIIDKVERNDKIGVCLDTCHVYDAGYDLVNDLDGVLEEFDRVVGLERLRAIHLNDSKNPFSSHKDRHEKIGEGTLGIKTFHHIINHPKLRQLPFYLETPNELPGYAKEIEILKDLYEE
ncbi:deoxyribonuclease IV [Sinanaerobacter chloroacetimidivorans]|uniref:Probable endonuclease 4 n=1 Tax=Sinanaerobacter chloroacetimidivorans TaxID=2818044 RepID=A0A8J7W6G7_9FIRM|nr:deoxyribonuclease IV [Sinanaerobacter chloroacetimidivorans]MBR0599911.1 deoxyribonuclease IV [Sinanaerobacter chloroacetimidivorans]